MGKRLLVLMLLLSVGGVAAPAAAGPSSSQLRRDVDALRASGVTSVLARLETPAGTRVATAGAGPLRQDPHVRIGSTTKTFVAVVVLQLVGEGRLSLSDPVERWLPGVLPSSSVPAGAPITVRDLLRHTSGLYEYTSDLIGDYITPELYERNRWRAHTPRELVAIAARHPAGGREHSYSNTNYVLAGMLIEAVTGRSWDAEVRARIVRPLGLRRTLTPNTWPFLPDPHVTAFHQFSPGGGLTDTTVAIRGIDSGADGSMISTPSEVNRFFVALATGRLLKPAQQAQMRALVPMPGEPAGAGAGLGIFYTPLSCGGGYWNHGGTGIGTWLEPGVTGDGRRRLTLAIFTNTFDPDLAVARQALVHDTIDHALCQ